MAVLRMWTWRAVIVAAIACSVISLPNVQENFSSWYSESEELEFDEENIGNETSEDQSQSENSEEPATESSDEEDAEMMADSEQSENDDSSGGQKSEQPDSSDEFSSTNEQPTKKQTIDAKWVIPATRIVVLSLAAVFAVGAIGTLSGALLFSEAGRVSLLIAVTGPILAIFGKGENGTFTRGRIQGYVEANPGIHFSALRDALALANGVTAHHLYTLEKEGKILSWLDGRKRRYASSGIDPKRLSEVEQPITGPQKAILQILAEAGTIGISSTELRIKLEASRQLMNYHLKSLNERGMVEGSGRGRARKWQLLEKGKLQLNINQHL